MASVALATVAAAIFYFVAAPAAVATPVRERDVAPTHQRIDTPQGPVHVWTPSGYDAQTAGIVVYVHGFFTDADRAWSEHDLPRQFAAAGVNALFVVPSAPTQPSESVRWPALAPLLARVAQAAPVGLPAGRVIVAGHSGAHRTITQWLGDERIATIVLMDGVYEDNIDAFKRWIDGAPSRRFLSTAVDTATTTARLHAMLPDTLVLGGFPPPARGHLPGAGEARAVYVKSQHDHMSLVTKGVALPMLLRATTLPAVASSSKTEPISAL